MWSRSIAKNMAWAPLKFSRMRKPKNFMLVYPPELLKIIKNKFFKFFNNQYCRCVFISEPSFFTCCLSNFAWCGTSKSRIVSPSYRREIYLFQSFFQIHLSFRGGSRENIFNSTISESTARSRKSRSDCFFCDFEHPVAPPLPPNSSHFVFVFEKINTLSRLVVSTLKISEKVILLGL